MTMTIYNTHQNLSDCHVPPQYNSVKSALVLMIPTARPRPYTRLKRLTKKLVVLKQVIMMTWQKNLFSKLPPSITAF